MTLLVSVVTLLVLCGAYFLGRFVIARASGVRGFRATLGLDDDAWLGVSLGRRVGTSAAGFVGYYLGASFLIALGLVLGGQTTVDDASMRVIVVPDGAAARAGVHDGDRMISVAGVPTPDWTTLKAEVAKHPGEAVPLRIERGGTQQDIVVTPDADGVTRGKIKVGPPTVRNDVSVVSAFGQGLVQPFRVVKALFVAAGRMFASNEHPELSGPVGIVQETNRAAQSSIGDAFRLTGAVAAYCFYVALIISALTIPRPKKKRA